MRNMFAQTFLEAAREDPRLCVVVADISPAGAMDQFRKEFPDRFVNTGVAEQIMIGIFVIILPTFWSMLCSIPKKLSISEGKSFPS